MTVAENEAREEFWNEYGLQAVMLRTAYVAGRTAEPCKEQIEAVTRLLWEDSRNLEPFEEVADAPEIIDEYRRWASTLLEAARKAVM